MISQISDAQPLQYFHKLTPTFNEDRTQPGIDFRPFYGKFFFDSNIISIYNGDTAYDLVITNDCGTELYRIAHTVLVSGVYIANFVPQDVIVGLRNGNRIRCCIVDPLSGSDSFDSSFDSSFRPLFTGLIYRTDAYEIYYNTRREFIRIQYSNQENYAKLDGYSAGTVFEIVVHAKFFRRNFPQTNESANLDKNTVVKLSSSVSKQKKLQVEAAPDYQHLKILFALNHNSILIQNQLWLKPENYDPKELNEHSAFQTAVAFLTESEEDFFANTYGTTDLVPTVSTTTDEPVIPCRSYLIENVGLAELIGTYEDCESGDTVPFNIAIGDDLTVCAKEGSVLYTSGVALITDIGSCGPTTTTTTVAPTTTIAPTTTPTPTTTDAPTTTIAPTTTTTPTTTAEPPCLQYRALNNSDTDPYNLQYDDCSGTHINVNPGPGSSTLFCTRHPGTISISGADVTLTLLGACP